MHSIATICFSPTLGGLELATLRRGAELAEHGHRVVAVLPDGKGLADRARELGIETHVVRPVLPYAAPVAARRLRAILDRRGVEILLVARTRDLSTAMLAAGRARAVVLYQQMQSGLNKHDWFHDAVYRRLDGCIAITDRVRREVIDTTVISPDRVETIPYPMDAERFAPGAVDRTAARAHLGVSPDALLVGMVGGFNPQKGQRELVQAIGIVAEEHPHLSERLHARIIGMRPGDSPSYLAELEALRSALPIADRVSLLPFLDDPRLAYAAFDVFAMPSYCETFGMVIQEAMAMGVASIGTDCGGVPEIVHDGHNGLIVPPRDARALANAIARLADDEPFRRRIADNARRFVLQQYEPTALYRRFEAALEAALERRRSDT